MVSSPNLALMLLEAAQAQKHVTVNEALLALDTLSQLSVSTKALSSPPNSTPPEGSRYIVGASASGLWFGKENNITIWQNGSWKFYMPKTGWTAYVADEGKVYIFSGTDWGMFLGGGSGAKFAGVTAITATGDYVKSSSGIRKAMFWGIGGGGAGGGVPAPTTGNGAAAGGGASGALFVLVRDIAAGEATSWAPMGIEIGAGGTCTAGQNQGGTGGTTRVRLTSGGTILAAADGGVGGQPMDMGNWGKAVNGGYGQNATGGNMNLTGNPGGVGIRFDGTNSVSGAGSPGLMAMGGPVGVIGNSDGGDGNAYGAGGSGAVCISGGPGAKKGGSGKAGVVWIWEYD